MGYSGGAERDPTGAGPYQPPWGNYGADSGGECGAMAAARFLMPAGGDAARLGGLSAAAAGDRVAPGRIAAAASGGGGGGRLPPGQPPFWYDFRTGPAHVVVASTEHDLQPGSPQHAWLAAALGSVDRCATPWLLLALHRPLYVPYPHKDNAVVGEHLRAALEPLLKHYAVDVALSGALKEQRAREALGEAWGGVRKACHAAAAPGVLFFARAAP